MLYDGIIRKTLVDKGWSGDKKYRAETAEGTFLLRVSPMERLRRREEEFSRTQTVAGLGIPMCAPLEFGICEEGVYTIQRWIDGVDAEAFIPTLPKEKQYAYGLDAGRILQKIHSIPAPADTPDWGTYFNHKIHRKIKMYLDCPLRYENGDAFQKVLAENRHLLAGRPQCYQHGDYHIGNMMVDSAGILTVIDFDKDSYGDPWEEFNRIPWCAQASGAFARGLVDGYFDGEVPEGFWRLLTVYISSNILGSLPWAIPFGEREIQTMRGQAAEILNWYNGMTEIIPSWYREG